MTGLPAGVRPTGGGRFDRDDRHAYFIAGNAWMEHGSESHPYVLLALSNVTTKSVESAVERMLDSGTRLFFDSGIFALASDYARTKGIPMAEAWQTPPEQVPGFTELWDRYVRLCKKHGDRLWGYAELDLGGTESKRRLRDRLHAEGLSPIPIYHPLFDGWDYYDELASQYDRLAWANLAGHAGELTRKHMVTTAWERHRRYPHLWVHMLGMTPNQWMPGLPADSCDSSSWLRGVRWGIGERGMTCLRSFSVTPRGFRYSRGDNANPDAPAERAVRLAAANYHMNHVTWRRMLADQAEVLGTVAYPEPLPAEGVRR